MTRDEQIQAAKEAVDGRFTSRPALERFREKWLPRPSTGCWIWTASNKRRGYGQFWCSDSGVSSNMFAHRASWLLHVGPIPDGQHVLHRCDVPACVNPDHLFLGTPADNVHDMHQKGRGAVGPKNRHAKLSPDDVRDIRSRGKTRGMQRVLAGQYGLSCKHVSDIVQVRTWRWLDAIEREIRESGEEE